ncbi:MAG: hypothetical protein J6X42_00040, partial [Alphaproteobacteria bacterium]|nr:hypothetical protein [Alphaproteobacteria bacterium]
LNSTMEQITMLVTNIRTMYGTQGNYNGLTNGSAVDLGIVPAVMDSGSGSGSARGLTNPFKGDVTISTIGVAATITTTGNTGFSVTYDGLPDEACIALATSDFGSGAGSGFIGAKLNELTASGTYGSTTEGNAYSMSTAIGTGGCSGDANSLTWYFY